MLVLDAEASAIIEYLIAEDITNKKKEFDFLLLCEKQASSNYQLTLCLFCLHFK